MNIPFLAILEHSLPVNIHDVDVVSHVLMSFLA